MEECQLIVNKGIASNVVEECQVMKYHEEYQVIVNGRIACRSVWRCVKKCINMQMYVAILCL